jgi:serine/threonine protein kinase
MGPLLRLCLDIVLAVLLTIHSHNVLLSSTLAPALVGMSGSQQDRSQAPRFKAPELLRGEDASVSSDIWSFGILLWEVFGLAPTPYLLGLSHVGPFGFHSLQKRLMRRRCSSSLVAAIGSSDH